MAWECPVSDFSTNNLPLPLKSTQVQDLKLIAYQLFVIIYLTWSQGGLSYSFTSWLLPKSLHVSFIRAISKTWYATISRECWKESSIIFVSKELRRLLITTVGTSFETDCRPAGADCSHPSDSALSLVFTMKRQLWTDLTPARAN